MELAQIRTAGAAGAPGRLSFVQKLVAAAALVALADLLFYCQWVGSTLGLFCLALLSLLLALRPDMLRHRRALAAAAAAALFALALIDDPSLLGFLLFWAAALLGVLLPRSRRFGDGWRWGKTLLRHLLVSPAGPFADFGRLRKAARRRPLGLGRRLPVLALPLVGSGIFLFLFASANPVLGDALAALDPSNLFGGLYFSRILFWALVSIFVWGLLRPRRRSLAGELQARETPLDLPGVSMASVTLSLAAFNAVFAVQNGLDLAFLWSGAPLPEGMTLAEYAHRGAYPLIVTALLAGLFVLVTLAPGSDYAQSALIRRLVYVWIAQNVFLVASTMLRTIDYIEAYSLTRLRIAALVWMALVAVGLVLICWRIWRGKSGGWLINANLASALLALAACTIVDLGATAAWWNVRHAREAGGKGARLDICYLAGIGSSALLPLIEIEGRTRDPALKARLASTRASGLATLAETQRDWHGWTFRGARRLAAARAEVERLRLPPPGGQWSCAPPAPRQVLTAYGAE
jgi:hypothetical protein